MWLLTNKQLIRKAELPLRQMPDFVGAGLINTGNLQAVGYGAAYFPGRPGNDPMNTS